MLVTLAYLLTKDPRVRTHNYLRESSVLFLLEQQYLSFLISILSCGGNN